jgi:hypothetical protein
MRVQVLVTEEITELESVKEIGRVLELSSSWAGYRPGTRIWPRVS